MTLISSQTQIKMGNHVATISKVNMEYDIVMSVMLTETIRQLRNVLFAKINGSRIMHTISIIYNNGMMKLLVVSVVNDKLASYLSPEIPKELNTWFTIEISQVKSNNEYKYKIELDGKEMHQVQNTHPKEFQNVTVYVSAHTTAPGYVRNLCIKGNVIHCIDYVI